MVACSNVLLHSTSGKILVGYKAKSRMNFNPVTISFLLYPAKSFRAVQFAYEQMTD